MIAVKGYADRYVAVLGLGKTGLATEHALRLGGAYPLCWDDDPIKRDFAKSAGINLADLNKKKVLQKAEILILSPGIPHLYPDPHPIVAAALSEGIAIDNDISLFFRSFASETWSQFQTIPKVVCITGSNGKSTTAALLAHILNKNKIPVEIGGNFGNSALTLTEPTEGEVKILEVSSYQSEVARSLQPDIAVFLNLSSDHFDRHGGIGGYFAAKMRLFSLGGPEKCIIGVDEKEGRFLANAMREERFSANPIISISSENTLKGTGWSVFIQKNFLVEWKSGKQIASLDLRNYNQLKGKHNYQNFSAAYACARTIGLSPKKIAVAVSDFKGLRHRTQVLGEKNGILFVNDSKATNAESASKSLSLFKNVRWILGGKEKEQGIETLVPIPSNIKKIYLIGQSQNKFASLLKDFPFKECNVLKDAVLAAYEDACEGDTILLAPACASFDQFKSFEERGDYFIKLFEML